MARIEQVQRGRGRGRGRQGGVGGAPGGAVANGGVAAPARARGRGRSGGASKAGISSAGMPGPGGRQLAARVASGKITQEQADRTMKQRQTLVKAFGPKWREKMSVGGKSFAAVRKGLAKNPKDPKLAALNAKLKANRAAMLERARDKNKNGKGGDE